MKIEVLAAITVHIEAGKTGIINYITVLQERYVYAQETHRVRRRLLLGLVGSLLLCVYCLQRVYGSLQISQSE